MKTAQQDERLPGAALPPEGGTPAGSFRRVLKHRAFVLLWVARLLSQIAFNAASYGVIAIVSFTLPAVPFSLLAGVSVDYLNKRLVH